MYPESRLGSRKAVDARAKEPLWGGRETGLSHHQGTGGTIAFMQAHKLRVDIPEDHRLTLDLPEGFPAGPAEVIVLAVPHEGRRVVSAGGALGPRDLHPEGDPIAEVLSELREERAATIERLAAELDRDGR